jgi:hypothetical protein
MNGFISYSMQDKFVAAEVARALRNLRIEPFLAHDDILVSVAWRDRILSELSTCDLFVPLLSHDFKKSEWCSMECGFILSRPSVTILPLSLDGTFPYGFLSQIQGAFLDIMHDLDRAHLTGRIRNGLLHHRPDFVGDLYLDGLERSPSRKSFRPKLTEVACVVDKLSVDHVSRLLTIMESRVHLFHMDKQMRSDLDLIYMGVCKKLETAMRERFDAFVRSTYNNGQPITVPQTELDRELILASVKEMLPAQPWPAGIHKEISSKLGLTPTRTTKCIQELIRRGDFMNQVDGQLIPHEETKSA